MAENFNELLSMAEQGNARDSDVPSRSVFHIPFRSHERPANHIVGMRFAKVRCALVKVGRRTVEFWLLDRAKKAYTGEHALPSQKAIVVLSQLPGYEQQDLSTTRGYRVPSVPTSENYPRVAGTLCTHPSKLIYTTRTLHCRSLHCCR